MPFAAKCDKSDAQRRSKRHGYKELTMEIIEKALSAGRTILTEHESKQVLAAYGIPVTNEKIAASRDELKNAAREIGFPLVLKTAGDVAHKTEAGLVLTDIRDLPELETAYEKMVQSAGADTPVLVQEMIKGRRELMAGLVRDPQFGPCVMFGLGGIFSEILRDVGFRVAPITDLDAEDMMQEIRARKILGEVRGMAPADRNELARILMAVGKIGLDHEAIKEIDINPLILRDGHPVAADALIVLHND
jgi:acyl-CoA synthetase (NDP forming)